jgi:hypothetical protein
MYRALLQPTEHIVNNNMIWEMKIPLKTKVFCGTFAKGSFLPKTTLVIANGTAVRSVFFCHQHETIKHLFFHFHFSRSIWAITQIGFTLYPSRSVTNIFGNWLNRVDNRFKMLIRVRALDVIW